MKVAGRTFENERIMKGLCKILLGTLEYKLWLLGFMSQFPFIFFSGVPLLPLLINRLGSYSMFRGTKSLSLPSMGGGYC